MLRSKDPLVVDVDDQDVVGVDDRGYPPNLDRVAPRLRVTPKPVRQSARFGNGIPEVVKSLDRLPPQVDYQLRLRLLNHHVRLRPLADVSRLTSSKITGHGLGG